MEALVTSLLGTNPSLTGVSLAVVVLAITALASGLVTPKWITKSLLDARNERVDLANLRAEDYKKLYEIERLALETARAQVAELLVTAETTKRIVNAIPVPQGGDST